MVQNFQEINRKPEVQARALRAEISMDKEEPK